MNTIQKQPKIFFGWWIVASCIPIAVLTNGVTGLGFTAFFEPLVKEFGWSYAQISLGASLRSIESSIFIPLSGYLADRWGPRKILFFGAVVTGAGMLLMSTVHSLGMYYLSSVIIAIGVGCCNQTVLLIAVVNWFKKNVSKAIGVTTIGVSLNGLMVSLATYLIDKFDWRTAMFSLGLAVFAIVVPLTLVIRHKPEQYGYLPDGQVFPVTPSGQEVNPKPADAEISLGQTLKSRTFWQLAIASLCFMVMANAYTTHAMPYYSSIGVVRSTASLIVASGLLLGIIGALGMGWLGDRLDKRYTATICYVLIILGLLCMAFATNETMFLLGAQIIFFNIGVQGAVVMRSALLREYFGRNRFGGIIGIHNGIAMLGGVAGPFLAGLTFDNLGNYRLVWLSFTGLSCISIILVMTIKGRKVE